MGDEIEERMRRHFLANFLDGMEGGQVMVNGSGLADAVAEICAEVARELVGEATNPVALHKRVHDLAADVLEGATKELRERRERAEAELVALRKVAAAARQVIDAADEFATDGASTTVAVALGVRINDLRAALTQGDES